MLIQNILITLLPDPDDYTSPDDKEWQEVCEELYLDIKKKILEDQIDIKSTRKEGSEDVRGADIFYILGVSLTSIDGFITQYELLKLWVDNRNQNRERVAVKIKIGDNEINISNIPKEEAFTLCERYLAEAQTKATL